MKKNLFEMGADFSDTWQSDNKDKVKVESTTVIKSPQKHLLYFAKEKRRGKIVTLVQPFHLNKSDLACLLKKLKKTLGTGGTVKENRLEFQGEVTEKLKIHLLAQEYRFKN